MDKTYQESSPNEPQKGLRIAKMIAGDSINAIAAAI